MRKDAPLLGRREEVNIHSKYLVVARAVPPQVAADVVSGRALSARLTHGYRRETLGLRRFTKIETPGGGVAYEMREPGQGMLAGFDTPPPGVSADVEYKEGINEAAFNRAWDETAGRRISKDRYAVTYSLAPGWPEHPATVDVYKSGIEGEVEPLREDVENMEELAGHMIVIVHFNNLGHAESFQHPKIKPAWMGENVTKPFSTKKLVQQLRGEDQRSLAPYYLARSATLIELEERAQLS